MAKSAKYYNVDDFNEYKKKRGKCVPPRINVLAAASYLQTFFDAKKFTWGFMGGLPMLCLGYKREMPDLHIAYDDKDFERLRSKLGSDHRIQLPIGVNPLLPFKILLRTGPEHRDCNCTTSVNIEVDLVPSGSYGAPPAGTLGRNLILLSLKTSDGQKNTFKCLNIRFLMATMLSYCKARNLLWDPKKDILFLCKNEHVEVQRIRTQLSVKEVQELFLGTPFFYRLHIDDQRLCYQLLLNADPPPTMAITPPAPQIPAVNLSGPLLLEQNTDARTSRSGYRKVSGQRSSSSGTSDHQAPNKPRPQSMEYLQDQRRPSHIIGITSVNTAKPQSVSAAIAAKRARRSMPNLTTVNNEVPTQNASVQGTNKTATHLQHHGVPHVSHISSQPKSTNQCQDNAISQLEYGGSFQPVHIRATTEPEDMGPDPVLDQNTFVNISGSTRTNSMGTTVQGIQSQKGSLHLVSPEEEEAPRQKDLQDKAVPLHKELHLVGSEGIYAANERLQRIQHHRNHSAPPLQRDSEPVFELDGMSSSKQVFIAELSASPIVLPPTDRTTTKSQDSLESHDTSRALYPRTSIAPFETGSIPTSLMAGGSASNIHRRSLSHFESSADTNPVFSTAQTNASRYLTCVFPQSAASEATKSSSQQQLASAYRAYRPFIASSCDIQQGPSECSAVGSSHSTDVTGHKRNVSNDSTASYDSSKLAQEYRELLNFENGYGSN